MGSINAILEIMSGVSLACCSSIFLTFFLFKDIQSKKYTRFIFYICICCFMFATATVLGGDLEDNSPACWYQALSTGYWGLAGILWILILSLQCYNMVMTSTMKMDDADLPVHHAVCWGLPLLTTLLPLTTNSYGNQGDTVSYCFVTERADSPSWGKITWTIFSFYLWIWLSLFLILYWLIRAVFVLRTKQRALRIQEQEVTTGRESTESNGPAKKKTSITSSSSSTASTTGSKRTSKSPQQLKFNSIWRSIYVLGLYPFTIVFCWGFTSMLRLWFIFFHGNDFDDDNDDTMDSYTVGLFANVLPAVQGAVVTCIFYSTNDEVSAYWKKGALRYLPYWCLSCLCINTSPSDFHTEERESAAPIVVSHAIEKTRESNFSSVFARYSFRRPSFALFRPSDASSEDFPPSTSTTRAVPPISSLAPDNNSNINNVTLSQSPAQVQMQTSNPMYSNHSDFAAADIDEDEEFGEKGVRLSRFAVPIIPAPNNPPSIYR